MATANAEAEKVKEDITGRRSTGDTAKVLQRFLTGDRTGSESASTRRVKPNISRTKAIAPSTREKESDVLSVKQRYSLATEVVNVSLKALTESAKARAQDRVPRHQHDHAEKRQALLPRSANSTPSKATSPVTKSAVRKPAIDKDAKHDEYVESTESTAICARTAFAFLRSSEAATVSRKDVAPLQLESGMLVLVAKLLANDLIDLAVKELRFAKQSLESFCSAAKIVAPAKETLAGLLNLDPAVVKHREALALAITYQALVLRTLGAARKPRSVEACVELLESEHPSNPSSLIMAQHSVTGDAAKARKALSTLSSAILAMCPSSSSKADEHGIDTSIHPAPEAVLRLQVMALRTQQTECSLLSVIDSRHDTLAPLTRCIAAYVRRTSGRKCVRLVYTAVSQAVKALSLDLALGGMEALPMLRTLCSLADEAQLSEEALSWAESIAECLCELDENHAQRLAAVIRATRLQSTEASVTQAVPAIDIVLRKKLSGGSADYEALLTELDQLCTRFHAFMNAETKLPTIDSFLITSASFAQRCIRAWPSKATKQVQSILSITLRRTPAQEDANVWINRDTAKAFCDTATVQALTLSAQTQSPDLVWAHSTRSLSLARVLRILVSRAVKATSTADASALYDDDNLTDVARHLILELQLKTVLEYVSRPKYRESVRGLLVEISRRLQAAVRMEKHPVRYLATACELLRIHDAHPDMLPSDHIKPWLRPSPVNGNLASDSGLHKYVNGLEAELQLVQTLRSGDVSTEEMSSAIALLERSFGTCGALSTPQDCLWDVGAVRSILSAVAYYHSALGETTASVRVLQLLHNLDRLADTPAHTLGSGIHLAETWMNLGFVEKAEDTIKGIESLGAHRDFQVVDKMSYCLALAEISLASDEYDDCKAHLLELETLRKLLPPTKVSREQRASYERLHAQGWLVHSAWSLATGAPREALAGAKHAVKILNSIWYRLEQPSGPEKQSSGSHAAQDDDEIVDLASGVSKLQLKPTNPKDQSVAIAQVKGAPFWPFIPLLSKALIMLSDLYVRHGLFSEATYYSTKAIDVAGAVGPSPLLSQIQSHRALLLTLAGDTEGAELCLAADEDCDLSHCPLAAVTRFQAKGAILYREKSFTLALEVYDEAERIIGQLRGDNSMREQAQGSDTTVRKAMHPDKPVSLATERKRGPAVRSARIPRTQARDTIKSGDRKPKATTSKTVAKAELCPVAVAERAPCYLLSQLSFDIAFAKALAQLNAGDNLEEASNGLEGTTADIARSHWSGRLQARQHLARIARELQANITYNMLPEAALALPAFLPTKPPAKPAAKLTAGKASSSRTKQASVLTSTELHPVVARLQETCKCLQTDSARNVPYASTAELHSEGYLRCTTLMPLSALPSISSSGAQLSEAMLLAVDQARSIAADREAAAIAIDLQHDAKGSPFEWPVVRPALTVSIDPNEDFRTEYIDILPQPWTAVSLTLDEECTELIIARYRRDVAPIFLRLPFARHKPEDMSEAKFDYQIAKTEIQEIIQRSNASCHNNGDVSSKGAKSSWWTERETLDQRLQELLLNMEEIWLGGFRGIFSTTRHEVVHLLRIRKDLVAILDRHLPSRQTARGKGSDFELDSSVLELFVSLRKDVDEDSEIDEVVTDLLYFVVDLLQLKGERNAYDEVDFDSMTVETLDALRSIEAPDASASEDKHLILVLDKRLQMFPWENLPCLQNASVSRVNSMLTLRKCIMAMRSGSSADGRYAVPRSSGGYILNPSLDLFNTQAILEPVLRKAAAGDGGEWTSIVKRTPSEDEFKTMLQISSMTLYFGHGAGSQYIRPRTIAKLDKCSEVVWLMGCSSGAVTEHGELEPQAVPLSYLMAGCKSDVEAADSRGDLIPRNGKCFAVLATLWDVTDKDIDRLSLAVGEEWGLFETVSESSRLPAKTPRKRDRMLAPSTPQQVPKTPKTPKVKKTSAVAATPARGTSRPRGTAGRSVSLVEAVSKSRDACYLRYLNGAAPVVYGVPVYLGD
ncbi:separin protein [Oleoguttula sp. CCFEE 5521]